MVRAIIDARQENDLEAASRFVAPESLDQGRRVTREDWRRKWEQMRAGCPDMEVITEHSVEDGEWVSNRLVRVRDGQLIEHWAFAEPLLPGSQ